MDRRGNSYSAGSTTYDGSGNGSGQRIQINKYGPLGNLEWGVRIGSNSETATLGNIVTDDYFVYVCMTRPHSGTGDDIYVYKLEAGDGDLSTSWTGVSPDNLDGIRSFNSASTNNDVAADLDLDSAGNLFVGGTCPGSDGTDLWLIKIEPDGDKAWDDTFDGSASSSNEVAVAIDTRDNGTTVVAGTETSGGTTQWCAMAWYGGGTKVWTNGVSFNGGGSTSLATDVTSAEDGSKVFICGFLSPNGSGDQDFAVAGFVGSSGAHSWTKVVADGANDGRAFAVTHWLGFVYAVGSAEVSSSIGNIENVTVKLVASSGAYETTTWPVVTGGSLPQPTAGLRYWNADGRGAQAHAVVVGGNGNVYSTGLVGGDRADALDYPDYLTLGWSATGTLALAEQYSHGSVNNQEIAYGIGLVGAGLLHVTGQSQPTLSALYDFATLQYKNHAVAAVDTLTLLWGDYVSGSSTSVLSSNDTRYVAASVEPNDTVEMYYADIRIVGSITSSTLSELSLHLEARTTTPETFVQQIIFWNYQSGQWDLIDSRLTLPGQDAMVDARVMGDPAPYRHSSSGEVKARIGYQVNSSEGTGWNGEIDHVEWRYVQ